MDRFERLLRVRRDDAAYSIARADDTDREFLAEKQAKSGPEHERAPAYDYLTTATTPVATETYADGMGRILSAANGVRLKVHLINSGSDPPGVSTQARVYSLPQDIDLLLLTNSHMHERGTRFVASTNTGQTPYNPEHACRAEPPSWRRATELMGGGGQTPQFLVSLMELQRDGRFPLERLVKFYDFEDVNQAIDDSDAGRTIKPVLRMAA
jgi:hypothetical protein